jgi:hypothetical protein
MASLPSDPYPTASTDQEMYNIKQHIRNNVLQKSKVVKNKLQITNKVLKKSGSYTIAAANVIPRGGVGVLKCPLYPDQCASKMPIIYYSS